VAPATALGVAVALIGVTANPPAPAIVYSAVYEHSSPPPRLPPPALPQAAVAPAEAATTPHSPVRIMIVGDSVGQTVGRGIERWAARTGAAVVRNAAIGWCAIGRGGVIELFDTGTIDQRGCVDFPQRWDIQNFKPDLTVVLSTLWELAPRRQPQWAGYRHFGDPVFDRWLESEYRAAADYLMSLGGRVIWLTAPCAELTASRARFWPNKTAELAAVERLNTMIDALPTEVTPTRLKVVDLFAHVCPGGQFTSRLDDVANARPDGLHFSDAGADRVAEWLGPSLTDDAAACPRRNALTRRSPTG
jgi:hypothetical protein